MGDVKVRRRYDASNRREKAHRNREGTLDAAQSLFLTRGYAATTVAEVAQASGVSPETIYKAFGGKAGLVKAIYDRGLAGEGPLPAYQRSDEMRERESDPRIIMREWGRLTAEVASVVTPIRLLLRTAAATDADMARLLEDRERERLERMRHHARFLGERGHLRDDVTLDEATDVLWTCSSAEFYELLVMQRGWSQERFAAAISQFMISALLPQSTLAQPGG
jgi:AcrR family transcriptional regulator